MHPGLRWLNRLLKTEIGEKIALIGAIIFWLLVFVKIIIYIFL